MRSVMAKPLARLCAVGLAGLTAWAGNTTPVSAAAAPVALATEVDSEKLAKVKAAFLLNFVKFTSWPANAFSAKDAPLVVVLLAGGDQEFADTVSATLRGRKVDGRPILVRRGIALPTDDAAARREALHDLTAVHVVYVPDPADTLTQAETRELNQSAVLTVGAGVGAARRDAILAFDVKDNKVGFFYNASAARSSPLTLSSKLLSLARPVN